MSEEKSRQLEEDIKIIKKNLAALQSLFVGGDLLVKGNLTVKGKINEEDNTLNSDSFDGIQSDKKGCLQRETTQTGLEPKLSKDGLTIVCHDTNSCKCKGGSNSSIKCAPTPQLSWIQLPNKGNIPIGAAGASLVHLNGNLIAFGGVQETPGLIPGPNIFFGDIHIYNLETNTWSTPVINGPKPAARSFHKAVADPFTNTMYLYGGVTYQTITGFEFTPFADFWAFNLCTLTWTLLANPAPPGVRIDPGLAINSRFDVVGGRTIYLSAGLQRPPPPFNPAELLVNDVWAYRLDTGVWELLIPNDPFNPDLPPVRYQARFDYNEKHNVILMYGGDVLPDNSEPRYDTWLYDIASNTWRLLDFGSMIPLFTGASGTNGDVFLLTTGEMRGGTLVPCIDSVTGKKNSPVNMTYAIQFTQPGAVYYELFHDLSILPNMQGAYTTVDGVLYLWGGLNFFCVSAGEQSAVDNRAIQVFNQNVWTLPIPKTIIPNKIEKTRSQKNCKCQKNRRL